MKRLKRRSKHFSKIPSCPVCNGTHSAELAGHIDWRVLICGDCKIGWTDPAPAPVDYAAENFRDLAYGKNEAPARMKFAELPAQWKTALTMQAALLARNLKPGARILDIGCGEGLLLEQLQLAGFCVQGIESSRDSSQLARDAGLDVVTGDFPNEKIAGPYDAVIMTHVLEHIEDFRATLAGIAKISPSGKLMLVQANPLSLMASREGRKWHAWCPKQHFWHFTPAGLEKAIVSLGWNLVEVEFSSLIHQEKDGSIQPLSQIAAQTPGLGDQFHFIAQIA
jgi:2-polyprenyl-3-methyl-5-hydroxy-6-metoxy-1,4-benzoquinol methylase